MRKLMLTFGSSVLAHGRGRPVMLPNFVTFLLAGAALLLMLEVWIARTYPYPCSYC